MKSKRLMNSPVPEDEIEKAWRLFEWNGTIRLTAKRGGLAVTGGVIKSKEHLYRACHNLEQGGWDIYVGANPARGFRIKAATREVEVWRYVVVDLDPVDPECTPEFAINTLLGSEEVTRLGLDITSASTVIFTGRGSQAWVALDPMPMHSQHDRATAERGMGAFLHWLKLLWGTTLGYRVDTSTSDLARIVRCPGTINTKTGRRAYISSHAGERGFTVASCALEPAAILGFAGPPPPEPTPLENCSNLNRIAPHLNERARQFLRMGVMEGERHKSAYAAAANLRELGVAFDQVLFWVRRGGRKCYPKLWSDDCDHCAREAWKGR